MPAVRVLAGALASVLWIGPAWAAACVPPAGTTLLDESFRSLSPGWAPDTTAKTSDTGLTLLLEPAYNNYFYTNSITNTSDAFYCVETVVPTDFDDGNLTSVGVVFLYENDKNYFVLRIDGQGTLQILRTVDERRTVLYGQQAPGGAKPGDVVALGVTVSGDSIKVYFNDNAVTDLTATKPVGDLSFGAYVHKDKVPEPTLAFAFNRMIVVAPAR